MNLHYALYLLGLAGAAGGALIFVLNLASHVTRSADSRGPGRP